MTSHSRRSGFKSAARFTGLALLGTMIGCASLLPKPPPAPAQFALDAATPAAMPSRVPVAAAPTLLVAAPRAAAGFDTRNIVYVRQAHEIEAFAYSQWVDTPALMLAPLIAQAAERTGAFRAVLRAPTTAAAELRLDTELIRLWQDFTVQPSRVQLTLHAVLVETTTRRVVAWQEFNASVQSTREDPYGGVLAANEAARQVLAELAAFCVREASR
jgi:cholesterol transport system auxiliary component